MGGAGPQTNPREKNPLGQKSLEKPMITCIMTALIYTQASRIIQQDYVSPGYTASRHPQSRLSLSMRESMSCCEQRSAHNITSKAEAYAFNKEKLPFSIQ